MSDQERERKLKLDEEHLRNLEKERDHYRRRAAQTGGAEQKRNLRLAAQYEDMIGTNKTRMAKERAENTP